MTRGIKIGDDEPYFYDFKTVDTERKGI